MGRRSAGWYGRQRAAERITALNAGALDLVSFWDGATSVLRGAVPYHLTPCWFTVDPASLLITSHYDHGMIPELPEQWLAHEYLEDDFNSLADIARSAQGASTLHEATGGEPGRSERFITFIRPYGGEQELLVALRTRRGETWGILALYRSHGQPMFEAEEISFLLRLAPYLAEGAQCALLAGEAAEPESDAAPGLLILDEALTIRSSTPGADAWVSRLAPGRSHKRGLPPPVLSVAAEAFTARNRGEIAFARVQGEGGQWIVVHAAPLAGEDQGRVAVILESAHPARITPLLMAAYGLTQREQDVTRFVLRGASTSDVAAHLSISPQTVQQHLKRVFEKTGVRSRRELVGKVFFAHYEPRLRDNEKRAANGRPLRGGPVALEPAGE